MKRKTGLTIAVLLFATLSVFSQTDKQLVLGEQPLYKVSRAKGTISVDGKMDELGWKDAEVRSFDYFFRKNEPLEKQKTKFRMLWDDKNIYLFMSSKTHRLQRGIPVMMAPPRWTIVPSFSAFPIPTA